MTAKTSTERSRERRARLDAEKVSEVRGLCISAVTRATWQACADQAGLPLNQWLETAANAQAKRDMRRLKGK